jgi:hypothetical protein
VRGPGYRNVDLSFTKNTRIAPERRQLQVRIECFNLLNWINYDNPNRTALTPTFGKIFSAGPPRQIRFGLRFMF